jgi:hypothetical protein
MGCPYAQVASITGVSQPSVLLFNDNGQLKSEAVLTINSSAPFDASVEITVPGKAPYKESLGALDSGINLRTVHVLELEKPRDNVTFMIHNNDTGNSPPSGAKRSAVARTMISSKTVEQQQVKQWKPTYQEDLKDNLYPSYLDDAFDRIEATASWPDISKFAYPIEASFMIYESLWHARDADWFEMLKVHINNGRISYPASYFNYTTEGFGTEELARSNYFSLRYLKDMLGVSSTRTGYMTDNPGITWSYIDALAEAGVTGYMLRFNDDRNWSRWDISRYPQMFYMLGRNPENKLLVWNNTHYMVDHFGFDGTSSDNAYNNVMAHFNALQNDETWPGDAWISVFTWRNAQGWVDNSGISPNVMHRIKGVNDIVAANGAEYPKIIASTTGDFFDYVNEKFSAEVPAFKGTIECWWNMGAPSTAWESAVTKENHDKLAAAETFMTFANIAADNNPYPQDELTLAWKNILTWDEHTWGPASSACDPQWFWKRNTALIADNIAGEVLGRSQNTLSELISTFEGITIAVYNPLSWQRSDIVRVPLESLPPCFGIVDIESGETVKYQKLQDGTLVFEALNVPGLGYKTFKVNGNGTTEPAFASSIQVTASTLENQFFRITFDNAGCISSIIDKRNSNHEMVDQSAPVKMNQYQLNGGSHITSAALFGHAGPVLGKMTAVGTAGTSDIESMERHVILYESIPRIDIVNDVLKSTSGYQTASYFVFPLNVDNFRIEHEMPTGEVWPHVTSNIYDENTEQYYTSSADHYTVNRWIDASNQNDYGITLAPVNSSLVEYGGARARMFDLNYNTLDPWIYSMVFNNHWITNFQRTQPSLISFKYSLTSHTGGDWKAGKAPGFGWEVSNPLRAEVIVNKQTGPLGHIKGQFVSVDKDNVVLTVAKMAEANGEGVILRFNEIMGENTTVTVDLGFLGPTSIMETDLVENDRRAMSLTENRVAFDIYAYGWKTLRVIRGTAPAMVTGVQVGTVAYGSRITWDVLDDDKLAFYEVFRGTRNDFSAGTGSYLGSTTRTEFFDKQVNTAVSGSYYYKVRAVRAGLKGPASEAVIAGSGAFSDTEPPSVPGNVKVVRLHGSRVSLTWTYSTDNTCISGYEIYRDGQKIADVDEVLNSHLDIEGPWNSMPYYQVAALDAAGNLSELSPSATHGPVLPGWDNIAGTATVTVSSEFGPDHAKENLVDSAFGKQDEGEWASQAEMNPWVQLDWGKTQGLRGIVLYDRSNLTDNVNHGTLSFSDGTSIKVTGIPTWGEAKLVTFPYKAVEWVRFQAEGGVGLNGGLSEIFVYGEEWQEVSVLRPGLRSGSSREGLQSTGGIANSNNGRKNLFSGK